MYMQNRRLIKSEEGLVEFSLCILLHLTGQFANVIIVL